MSVENEINDDSEEIISEDFPGEMDAGGSDSSQLDTSDVKEKENEERKDEKRPTSSLFSEFLNRFDGEETSEAKIRISIDFMRDALSNSGTPRFKDFWEGRKLCLPLFKENVSAKVRSQLWSSYIELSTEAKRLKEILDEQSAFAVEQIELAVLALERDLQQYAVILSQSHETVVSGECVTLGEKKDVYNLLQRELYLLNTLASRVNSMRKEVVKTEMRIRIKNKLLERLSLCGDQVFPKRKELIKRVSQEFVGDIDRFVQSHFQTEDFDQLPLYALREEIKTLQSIAKMLTLNTHAFTETRLKLSGCWDKIKDREKERKKESQQMRLAFKQNFDLVLEKVKAFAEACKGEMSQEECNRQSSEISEFMKTLELGREEVRALKDEIFYAKKGILDRVHEVEREKQRKNREAEAERRDKMNALKDAINTLLQHAASMKLDPFVLKVQEMTEQLQEISLSKSEKLIIDRLFKQLKDVVDDKKEKALLNLSEDDLKAIDQLMEVLEERKARRVEIKNQLEVYRKQLGGSGFDFEKAMMYRELIEAEKAALNKINASIDDIEEKISEIEG